MSMLESMARAMYDDNLRQINVNHEAYGIRHGIVPMLMTQPPFAEAGEIVRGMYLSYARAVLEPLRYLPHQLLDVGRGDKMASGDAARFWYAVIDAIKEGA